MANLLACQGLTKTFGPRPLFEHVALTVADGDCVGMIGPNGSGKSTLLKILAGLETPDGGTVTARRGLTIGYVGQQDVFDPAATVLDLITAAVAGSIDDPHERLVEAELLLSKAGLTDMAAPAASLSGGWRKRLAITRALAGQPDLLLLDEPTNHLDLEGIVWLEALIEAAGLGVIVVTHDRYFLEDVASKIVELSSAYPNGTFETQGAYSRFLEKRAAFLEAQARQEQALAGKVRADIAWLSRGAKARRTKAKGRIQEAGQRMQELAELRERNAPARAAGIDFAATGRQSRKLVEAHGLTKSMGGKLLFAGLDLVLGPGMRLGVLGPNGSGKTTLMSVLAGRIAPDGGTLKLAANLRVVYFSQQRQELDPTQQVRHALCPVGDTVHFRGRALHVSSWAKRFLFRPEQLNVSVGDLSGGEQARILIARLMLQPADLLLMDEPTNDLDIDSLEVLEESLAEFAGAVVLVTHDRFMLGRVSTDILSLDGRGGARFFADYFQWEAAQEDPGDGDTPAPKAAAPAPAPTGRSPAAGKLSYHEQREFGQIMSNITAAEADVSRLEVAMTDPATLADHKKLDHCCRQLDAAHQRVRTLYARWEELEARQK